MPLHEHIYGYDLDAVLIATPPPTPPRPVAYLGDKRRETYFQLMRQHYGATGVAYNPPQRKFHVITACRGEGIRPYIRIWLGGHFIGRSLSVTFLDSERSLQAIAEFKAAIITRYAMTDFCDGSVTMLKALDLKLPNHVRLHLFDRSTRAVEPFRRNYNRRLNDGPDL